jgi:lipoprotein-releasing system permease protein
MFSKSKSFTKVIIYIAIAGVAISIATMILATAVINGFKSEVNAKIFGFWGHIHVYDAGIMRNFELRPIEVKSDLVNTLKKQSKISYEVKSKIFGFESKEGFAKKETHGGIKSVHPYIVLPSLIESKSEMVAALYKGIDENYDWTSLSKYIIKGKAIDIKDTSDNQIIISKILADKLNLDIDKKIIITFIKDKVKIKKALVIKGIYNTGLEEYDNRFVIGNSSLAQDILDWSLDQYSGIEIVLDDIRDMDVMNEYIYSNVLPQNFYSETIKEKFPNIFDWLKLQDINEKVIIQLMSIVAIINLVTILLILILERTPMIGILKSMGATNMQIRSIFIINAAYILLLGLLFGNLIGIGLAWLQKSYKFIKLDEKSYYLDFAPIKFDVINIIIINGVSFIVCFLFLLIPSYIISKMQPVNSIKFN